MVHEQNPQAASVKERNLNTDPDLADVLAELIAREPIFHRAEYGTSRKDFESMMAPEIYNEFATSLPDFAELRLATMDKAGIDI